MRSRIIQTIMMAIILAFASPVAAADSGDKTAFKAAYKAYQAATEAKDAKATATAAHDALHFGEKVFPDDSPSLAALHINYGDALLQNRKDKAAVEPLKEGIRRYELLYGENDGRLIDPLWWLGNAYSGNSLHDDEEGKVRKRVLDLVEKVHGRDSLIFADANMEVGKAHYFDYRRQRRATRYFEDAYETYARLYGQPAYKTGVAAFWLGKASEQMRRRNKAEKLYLKALEIFEETSPPGHDLQLMAHTYLIKLYEDRGKSDEADMHCQAISRLRPLAVVDGYHPLFKRPPDYPETAIRAARSGYVIVEFSVTTIGTVANASVIESEGGKRKEFEIAALKAVEGFRYAPAVKDGVLVETTDVRNKIIFKISKN